MDRAYHAGFVLFCRGKLRLPSVTVTVTEAVTEAETVTVGIVLVIPVQALTPHHHTPKGLDAPLMSPMTSRTGPKGRSETTFFARFILRAVTSVTAR